MAFQIRLTERAIQDIREAVTYIHQSSPQAAEKWFWELVQLQSNLQEMPLRFALIPEAEALGKPYRSAPITLTVLSIASKQRMNWFISCGFIMALVSP